MMHVLQLSHFGLGLLSPNVCGVHTHRHGEGVLMTSIRKSDLEHYLIVQITLVGKEHKSICTSLSLGPFQGLGDCASCSDSCSGVWAQAFHLTCAGSLLATGAGHRLHPSLTRLVSRAVA